MALRWLEIFISYSTSTKAFTILEIAMFRLVLLIIHLPFKVRKSLVSFLLNFPRVFFPTSVFMNQTYFVTLNPLTLGIKKNGWGKGASSNGGGWRIIILYISMIFNVTINYWPMILHKIVINIKLPIFSVALLVPTKKKDKKLKNVKNKFKESKKFQHQKNIL